MKLKSADIPDRTAYYDGNRYHCYNIECYADGATLKEIAREPTFDGLTYLPILRCNHCHTLYFGVRTIDKEKINAIRQAQEKNAQEERERAQKALKDNEISTKTFEEEEQRREAEQLKECEDHESEIAGDITIPNVITPFRKETPRHDKRDRTEDIITLPNIQTIL